MKLSPWFKDTLKKMLEPYPAENKKIEPHLKSDEVKEQPKPEKQVSDPPVLKRPYRREEIYIKGEVDQDGIGHCYIKNKRHIIIIENWGVNRGKEE